MQLSNYFLKKIVSLLLDLIIDIQVLVLNLPFIHIQVQYYLIDNQYLTILLHITSI